MREKLTWIPWLDFDTISQKIYMKELLLQYLALTFHQTQVSIS